MPWIPGPDARKHCASSGSRSVPYIIFGNASSTRWAGCAKVRAKPCTIGDRTRAGRSAKITLSEAITYVDWAQTGFDAGFYGSGCTGLWGGLPGILRQAGVNRDLGRPNRSEPPTGRHAATVG